MAVKEQSLPFDGDHAILLGQMTWYVISIKQFANQSPIPPVIVFIKYNGRIFFLYMQGVKVYDVSLKQLITNIRREPNRCFVIYYFFILPRHRGFWCFCIGLLFTKQIITDYYQVKTSLNTLEIAASINRDIICAFFSPRAQLYRCNLFWKENTTLIIGWANIIKVCYM